MEADRATRDDAEQFLMQRIDYERMRSIPYGPQTLKLSRMRHLLRALGDPQRKLQIVHIAGSKGKGSTAHLISGILTAAGYRTGLYTSPHLEALEERFAVDGTPCLESEFTDLVTAVMPAVRDFDARGNPPTFFEICTAIAFLHFVRSSVDVAILEVGLGGRLDSTNVCEPLVSVITSISFDHMQQLGNTLGQIAREKAGIIKPGVTVVSGVTAEEPAEVIARTAAERGSPLWRCDRDFILARDDNSRSFRVTLHPTSSTPRTWNDLRVAMPGNHQQRNAAVAIAAVSALAAAEIHVSAEAVRAGLARVQCPVRVERVHEKPTVIIDAAHNAASVDALLSVVEDEAPMSERTLIFAASEDKDVAGMLAKLVPAFHHIVFTEFQSNPRGASATELKRLAVALLDSKLRDSLPPPTIEVLVPPEHAWRHCWPDAQPGHLLCIAGSFFLAAELRTLVQSDCARDKQNLAEGNVTAPHRVRSHEPTSQIRHVDQPGNGKKVPCARGRLCD